MSEQNLSRQLPPYQPKGWAEPGKHHQEHTISQLRCLCPILVLERLVCHRVSETGKKGENSNLGFIALDSQGQEFRPFTCRAASGDHVLTGFPWQLGLSAVFPVATAGSLGASWA